MKSVFCMVTIISVTLLRVSGRPNSEGTVAYGEKILSLSVNITETNVKPNSNIELGKINVTKLEANSSEKLNPSIDTITSEDLQYDYDYLSFLYDYDYLDLINETLFDSNKIKFNNSTYILNNNTTILNVINGTLIGKDLNSGIIENKNSSVVMEINSKLNDSRTAEKINGRLNNSKVVEKIYNELNNSSIVEKINSKLNNSRVVEKINSKLNNSKLVEWINSRLNNNSAVEEINSKINNSVVNEVNSKVNNIRIVEKTNNRLNNNKVVKRLNRRIDKKINIKLNNSTVLNRTNSRTLENINSRLSNSKIVERINRQLSNSRIARIKKLKSFPKSYRVIASRLWPFRYTTIAPKLDLSTIISNKENSADTSIIVNRNNSSKSVVTQIPVNMKNQIKVVSGSDKQISTNHKHVISATALRGRKISSGRGKTQIIRPTKEAREKSIINSADEDNLTKFRFQSLPEVKIESRDRSDHNNLELPEKNYLLNAATSNPNISIDNINFTNVEIRKGSLSQVSKIDNKAENNTQLFTARVIFSEKKNTTLEGKNDISSILDAQSDKQKFFTLPESIDKPPVPILPEPIDKPPNNRTKNVTQDENTTIKTTISLPMSNFDSQLGANPHGTNPRGTSPFGLSPQGISPFGSSPEGTSPQGDHLTIKNITSTVKPHNQTTSNDVKEERFHVQIKKPDGSINGNYVVLDHLTGNLNGVRYDAVDGADQALIQKALLSFLSLDPRLDPRPKS